MRGYLKKQKTAFGNIAGSGLEVAYEQTDTSDLRPHECRRIQSAHGTKQGGRAARQRMAHGAAHRQSSHHQSGRRHVGLSLPAQSEGAGDQRRGSCLQQRIWHGRGTPASTRLSEGHLSAAVSRTRKKHRKHRTPYKPRIQRNPGRHRKHDDLPGYPRNHLLPL